MIRPDGKFTELEARVLDLALVLQTLAYEPDLRRFTAILLTFAAFAISYVGFMRQEIRGN